MSGSQWEEPVANSKVQPTPISISALVITSWMYIDEKRMWLSVGISLLLRRVRSSGHAKAKVISPGPGLEIIITNVWSQIVSIGTKAGPS